MLLIHPNDTILVSKQSVWCDLDGDIAILHLASGVYFGLEGAGGEIWNFLQEPRSVGEIVDHLMEKFDVQRHECEQMTFAFLEDLATKELIVVQAHAGVL